MKTKDADALTPMSRPSRRTMKTDDAKTKTRPQPRPMRVDFDKIERARAQAVLEQVFNVAGEDLDPKERSPLIVAVVQLVGHDRPVVATSRRANSERVEVQHLLTRALAEMNELP
jgi:hypothetical protein